VVYEISQLVEYVGGGVGKLSSFSVVAVCWHHGGCVVACWVVIQPLCYYENQRLLMGKLLRGGYVHVIGIASCGVRYLCLGTESPEMYYLLLC
jgi:hypothetical protein